MIPLCVALLAAAAFLPVLGNGFVSWDDSQNFVNNPHYRGLGAAQLGWMWTTFHLGHYVPLSWMTLGFDYVAWGMNPMGYHLTNLVLHAANAVLLYLIARRLFRLTALPTAGARSHPGLLAPEVAAAFAALLFAVHPLRVESVAWVTERRDMLSLGWYLLSILIYLQGVDRPNRLEGRLYWLSVLAFAASLLSKGTGVSLPVVFAILNVYPLKRLGGDVGWRSPAARRVYVELIPFALLAGAVVVLSIVALHPPGQLSAGGKLVVSVYSLAFYLWKTIVPVNLSPLYEMPRQVDPGAARFVASYVAVIALAGVAWAIRRRWPGVTACLLAFVVIVLPMLGIVQNGPQIAADRYTYHAAPALAILVGAGLLRLERPLAVVPITIAAGILIALGALTWKQTDVWHDSERLWSRVLAIDSESAVAHSAMASVLFKQNRVADAMEHSRRAVALAPDYAEAHNDLGVGLAHEGKLAESVEQYQRALVLKPEYDEAQNNWGVVTVQQGDLDSAVEHYREALANNPDNADAHVNWGNVLVRQRRWDEAIAHYRQALWIRPDHADAELNWGVALAQQGKLAEAIEHFRQALAINPDLAEAKEYLARATQSVRQ